jgi:hypothetical protein
MDTRFTAFSPQTCESPEFGAEPPLLGIIEHYYRSHGIEPVKASKLAVSYIKEWTRLESEALATQKT